MRSLHRLACLSVAAALSVTLAACGDGESASQGIETEGETVAVTESGNVDSQTAAGEGEEAVYLRASEGDGIVNAFIGERFYDGKVTDENEAEECVKSVLDRIGGDETTELEINSVRPTADGNKVVIFSQRAGGVLVYGATVKLVVDKDDVPIALVSSIMPDVRIRPIEEWAVDDKQAEQIVMDMLREQDAEDTLVEGASERAIIGSTETPEHYVCVWIVYTLQTENDDEAHQAYAAHYVTADGTYLYSLPVSEPGDADSLSGASAAMLFDFEAFEPDEMSVTLTHHDGTTEEVSLPVLKDPATGVTYLADARRKIVCADFASTMYGDEPQLTEVQDGYDPIDVASYHTFIRVWDFFDSVGWTGPDGDGTPSLLLMNYVDTKGEPIDNAVYITKMNGFVVFSFTRASNFGECLDVIAHEFTHVITGTTMTANLYKNDQGAINEGMSDVLGNLVEMRLDGDAGAWTIAEGRGQEGIVRNMANPHEYAQPEFAFDTYYAPRPAQVTGLNDQGGVHSNSSLLNIVSYRLHEAGMPVRDQGYYWLNVALVLSPQTDYPMLAEILPWVMETLGYSAYVEPLKAAIDEARFTATEAPDEIPSGCGAVTFDFSPIEEAANDGLVTLVLLRAPDADVLKRVDTWPIAETTVARATVPAGDYYVLTRVGDPSGSIMKLMVLTADGWRPLDEKGSEAIKESGTTVSVVEGETLEIENDTFGSVATAQLEQIEQELQD